MYNKKQLIKVALKNLFNLNQVMLEMLQQLEQYLDEDDKDV